MLPLELLSTLIHIIAVALWVGTMVFFLVVLGPSVNALEPRIAIQTLNRGRIGFELLSWIAIALLLLTGVFNLLALFDIHVCYRGILFRDFNHQAFCLRRDACASLTPDVQIRAGDRQADFGIAGIVKSLARRSAWPMAAVVSPAKDQRRARPDRNPARSKSGKSLKADDRQSDIAEANGRQRRQPSCKLLACDSVNPSDKAS